MTTDWAGWTADLDERQARLVSAFRAAAALVTGAPEADWQRVERALTDLAAPGRRRDAAERFGVLVTALGRSARRTLSFHTPGCPCLGRDEADFLALCSELADGRTAAARAAAARLLREDAVDAVLERAAAFVATLAARHGEPQAGPGAGDVRGERSPVSRQLH